LPPLQTGSGAHPASYEWVLGVLSPGGKAVRTWRWPLTSI